MKRIFLISLFLVVATCVLSESDKLDFTDGNYYIVLNHNVNLREKTSIKSKVTAILDIGHEVVLLKKSGQKEKIDNNTGEWVYVDIRIYDKSGTDNTIKGWVFDYFLSDGTDFKPVESFRECEFDHAIGDCLLSYRFYKDGTYKHAEITQENKYVYLSGRLYRNRDVIIAHDGPNDNIKGAAPSNWTFYLNSKGILCDPRKDEKGNNVCAKCK